MRAASWVALSVFRESVRDRVPYNLVLFAVLLIGSSFLLGQLTAGQDVKIIKDLGLAAIGVFGLFIAIFIGIGLVSKEVERRSIYSLLSKPVSRAAVHRRQVRRSRADACGQRRGDDARALRRARLHDVDRVGRVQVGVGCARHGSPPAHRDLSHLRRADARDGGRALLLDVFNAAALGGADPRPLYRRPLQHRVEELRSGGQLEAGRLAGSRRSTICCPTCRPSTSRPRSSTDCR